jgi:hypothetical protein
MARFKAGLSLPDTSAFLHNQYIRKASPSIPSAIDGLIGWWDFSQANTLFQQVTASTAVTATNDPVGHVINKAPVGNGLGRFLRALGDTGASALTRPLFKTGGLNGHTYVEFDGSRSILTGSRAAGWGGTTDGSEFSPAQFNNKNRSRFFVIKPRSATYTSDRHIVEYWGRDSGGSDTRERTYIEESDDQINLETMNIQLVDPAQNNTTVGQMWSYVAGPGATTFMHKNGDPSLGVSGISLTGTDYQDFTIGIYTIGAGTNALGLATGGTNFEGSVYEVLEFNRTLSKLGS